jgi:gamma-glutamyltranspeptidase/glutathione hydrolase
LTKGVFMAGMISAGDPATAAAGAAMLAAGGNAVDAAVAAAFASFIAEIGVVHLGGSGIAQIFDPQTGQAVAYDFFSVTPGLGRDRLPADLDFEGVEIDFGPTTQEFYLGRGSVAVPGNIAGLCQMAADYGRLPLSKLLEPAIQLARDGHPLEAFQSDTCDLLAPLYTHTPSMRSIFAADGRMIQPGETLFIPNLAETLEALAQEGAEFARSGRLAQTMLTDQATRGGLLTAADLEQYQVLQVEPIRLPYRDYEILLPPPCSSGGALIAFSLKLMAAFPVSDMAYGSAFHLRFLYEVMAAATRARPVWDAALETMAGAMAVASFLDDAFIENYVDELHHALHTPHPSPAFAELKGPSATSHLSVIDGDGLAVSLTTTAGESAGYVVPGTGYIPNNMLGEADLHPAGFHTRPAGQRIPTMMTPTVVLENGQTRLVVGSGGSIRIRSAILQTLSNFLDFGMGLEAAVNAPRVHLADGVLQCELGIAPAAMDELAGWGYPLNRWDKRSIYFGGAHSVAVDGDGRLTAVGDNRRGGATAAV